MKRKSATCVCGNPTNVLNVRRSINDVCVFFYLSHTIFIIQRHFFVSDSLKITVSICKCHYIQLLIYCLKSTLNILDHTDLNKFKALLRILIFCREMQTITTEKYRLHERYDLKLSVY